MKKFYLLSIILITTSSCSNESKKDLSADKERIIELKYDTTAIDSFGPGAQNVNIAQNIKMSSIAYRDSIAEVVRQNEEKKRLEEERLIKEELHKKEEKEKLEKEKEKNQTTTAPSPIVTE